MHTHTHARTNTHTHSRTHTYTHTHTHTCTHIYCTRITPYLVVVRAVLRPLNLNYHRMAGLVQSSRCPWRKHRTFPRPFCSAGCTAGGPLRVSLVGHERRRCREGHSKRANMCRTKKTWNSRGNGQSQYVHETGKWGIKWSLNWSLVVVGLQKSPENGSWLCFAGGHISQWAW